MKTVKHILIAITAVTSLLLFSLASQLQAAGMPVYESDWTDVKSVDLALQYLMSLKERRRNGERLVPFRVEKFDYRVQNQEGFQAGLARSGPKAVKEFDEAF